MMTDSLDPFGDRLTMHLRSWVGTWPPPPGGVHVVGDPARLDPTWDGAIRPLQGVGNGLGTVIAVPPDAVAAVDAVLAKGLDRPGIGNELGEVLGTGPAAFGAGVFRTTAQVDPALADLGVWFDQQADELPAWLAPFNGPRLVAFDDDGRPIGGVGVKIHDPHGHELAVVTEPAARGTGIARRLVATAARRILDEGAAPTYLHDPANLASARVAEAVGFSDRGWRVFGLWPRNGGQDLASA
jgi:GNAT superfamily N-acetyltransferase